MITLTPETIDASYELLRTTLPFRRWNLPKGDDVVFRVVRSIGCTPYTWAQHLSDRQTTNPFKGQHLIDVNELRVRQLGTLIVTMAHELCHVRESMLISYTGEAHGATFNRLADQVCRHHGFDRGAF